MKTMLPLVLGLAFSLAASNQTQAALMLNVTSPQDLSDVSPGSTVTIRVDLSGVDPAEPILALSAIVEYDETLFSDPQNLTAGGIVLVPGDFIGNHSPGLASGDFVTLNLASSIIADGVFFSFDVTALGPLGTTSFEITDARAAGDGSTTPNIVLGPGLNANVAVPEPASSLVLGGMILLAAVSLGRRRAGIGA